jgi:hypothetical protein
VKKGSGKKPNCHPNRKHYAKGLCAACYHTQAKKRKTKQPKHKEPVVVTHTHEVIRQVQLEEKHKMAAHENDKPAAKPTEIPGHTGKTGGPYERAEGASKEAVVSDAGTTEPTQVFGGDGVTAIADWEKSQEERRKKQAEFDEKRRKQAVEDSGIIQTTAKHGIGAKHNG